MIRAEKLSASLLPYKPDRGGTQPWGWGLRVWGAQPRTSLDGGDRGCPCLLQGLRPHPCVRGDPLCCFSRATEPFPCVKSGCGGCVPPSRTALGGCREAETCEVVGSDRSPSSTSPGVLTELPRLLGLQYLTRNRCISPERVLIRAWGLSHPRTSAGGAEAPVSSLWGGRASPASGIFPLWLSDVYFLPSKQQTLTGRARG